jgi:hypothetical protein
MVEAAEQLVVEMVPVESGLANLEWVPVGWDIEALEENNYRPEPSLRNVGAAQDIPW